MGVEDIREIWGRLTAGSSDQQGLDEEQIRMLLAKRSKNLMERIDFNIRIGFFILLGIIMFIVMYDFFNYKGLFPAVLNKTDIPAWLIFLDIATNLLIVTIFVSFFIRYFRVRKLCTGDCDIRHSLMKVIGILTLYQRLFTVALIIIMLSSGTGFLVGYFTSIQSQQIPEGFMIPVILFGVFLIVLLTLMLFLLLRWIFRRIYGNYLAQLRETLAELDELEE
jgi:hypothetical protein